MCFPSSRRLSLTSAMALLRLSVAPGSQVSDTYQAPPNETPATGVPFLPQNSPSKVTKPFPRWFRCFQFPGNIHRLERSAN